MDGIFEGSKEVEIIGSSIWALWWVGETVHPSSVVASVFSHVCGHALLCWGILATFYVRSYSPEMLLQGFKSLNVQIWVNGLSTWHSVYQNHPLCIPKTVALTFPVEGVALNYFFQEEVGLCHSIHCLCGGFKAVDQFCHPQWQSMTKCFNHQPYNRGANLNTPLSI